MKTKIAVFTLILCVLSSSPTFARGYNQGHHRGDHYSRHDNRPNYHHTYRRGHRNDGLGIAFGVVGGLLLGTALISSATAPPPAVVYGAPYPTYQPEVVVQQPRICAEERLVSGEWQVSQYSGQRIWVSFPYPVTQTFQVPCY